MALTDDVVAGWETLVNGKEVEDGDVGRWPPPVEFDVKFWGNEFEALLLGGAVCIGDEDSTRTALSCPRSSPLAFNAV